ncbi:hypothetical protein M408DRAFT_311610 [Serendipita vermifera MAFF 305830]|uniref:Uncharacterized protein n=1 Tax=Serendipita vermifera MAFF 305830 TaxID=933852 RepID=A0A0C2WL67_SERVB|nr:hypothetical protein M408DRAFT_311610 [Serendipita vermifera MAFF 305830]
MSMNLIKAHHTVMKGNEPRPKFHADRPCQRARVQGLLEDLLNLADENAIEIHLPHKGAPAHDQGDAGPLEDERKESPAEDETMVERQCILGSCPYHPDVDCVTKLTVNIIDARTLDSDEWLKTPPTYVFFIAAQSDIDVVAHELLLKAASDDDKESQVADDEEGGKTFANASSPSSTVPISCSTPYPPPRAWQLIQSLVLQQSRQVNAHASHHFEAFPSSDEVLSRALHCQ